MLSGYFHFGNNHIFVQFALFKDIFFVGQMVVVMYDIRRLLGQYFAKQAEDVVLTQSAE